ncbi:hypothetical protein GCK72_011210 [Caenorhabditis remanei]|uniref:Uncharacterized protein n=1 Tax=Caenorhabditis remanei TaxID=31234 RepID=A0A6A5H757_CAERE|nr:hypothetical protein GCK72_011210 [Caenorhabditis remanei]KAF1762945.1 hypothetical protein GCK72_011210 [Caenorhabditis remanei]
MILLSSIFTMFSSSVTIILFGRNPNPLKYPKRPSSSFYYLSEDLDVPSYFPFLIGLSLLCISDVLTMLFFVIFILEGACSCNIKYRQWKEFLVFIMMFAVITTYTMANFIGNWYDLLVHLSCSVSISIYIIDIHVLSCNQIRVKTSVQMRNNTAKPQENHLFLGDSFIV